MERAKIKRQYLDVAYDSASKSQKLDIYIPSEGDKPYPVIFHIHGGAFMMCDKSDNQVDPYLKALDLGFAVVSVNYRLSKEAGFPSGIIDCKTALRFIKYESKNYNLNPSNIFVVGGSSGGNYTLMLASTQNNKDFENNLYQEYDTTIKAAVAWYPPTDFLLMDYYLHESNLGHETHSLPISPESIYMGGQITKLDYDYVQKANPMTYIDSYLPPILIQHGLVDATVPYQMSVLFTEKANKLLGENRVILEIIEDAKHADKKFETDDNMIRVFDFIEKYCY